MNAIFSAIKSLYETLYPLLLFTSDASDEEDSEKSAAHPIRDNNTNKTHHNERTLIKSV
ncbi:hypothetical protein HpBGD46_15240 [Helicobacter pylori]